jgi:hypothetical protein
MTTDTAHTAVLTASEKMLLNAGAFAPKPGMLDTFRPVGTELEVSKKQLAQMAYAAAFLSLQSAGELKLEVCPKKALLGLRTTHALYAEPATGSSRCPDYSLEADLLSCAQQLQARKGQHEVNNVVYTFLGVDVPDPFGAALQMIYDRLSRRDLLRVVQEKKLKVFTVRHFELPTSTADLASGGVEDARQLIESCQKDTAELWKMLLAQIEQGIARRREQQDIDLDD